MDTSTATASLTTATDAIRTLYAELFDGAPPNESWIVNPGDPGALATLARLTPEQASAHPLEGHPSIAAHLYHLRYQLELLNWWGRGEERFSTADWKLSWQKQEVSDDEWRALLDEVRARVGEFREALAQDREWDPISLTGAIASAAHMAYHLGAIRQLRFMVEQP